MLGDAPLRFAALRFGFDEHVHLTRSSSLCSSSHLSLGFGARGFDGVGREALAFARSEGLAGKVKIWFQNRRTKWKKKDNISNAEVAEFKQQHKPEERKLEERKLEERKPEDEARTDPLALDMSKKTNKILSDKLKSTKLPPPKARKVEKGVLLESISDVNDIESRISITKITNKLSSAEICDVSKVLVRSYSPEEVKELKYSADTVRDVEM
ncbi:unnamed protein product [Plutella xylostella]|uniref:(diamondback moth) hypothetical protein n=1 Tax=Plutella xylostella TaxID=51655 RepID=A0A8S4G5J9_PLUXY|nr:unnamed protein product [Plutella xylostella]